MLTRRNVLKILSTVPLGGLMVDQLGAKEKEMESTLAVESPQEQTVTTQIFFAQ